MLARHARNDSSQQLNRNMATPTETDASLPAEAKQPSPSSSSSSAQPIVAKPPKQPPPESKQSLLLRRLSIASFWAVVVFLGLPIWLKTTAIYRAELPLQEMTDWAEGKV